MSSSRAHKAKKAKISNNSNLSSASLPHIEVAKRNSSNKLNKTNSSNNGNSNYNTKLSIIKLNTDLNQIIHKNVLSFKMNTNNVLVKRADKETGLEQDSKNFDDLNILKSTSSLLFNTHSKPDPVDTTQILNISLNKFNLDKNDDVNIRNDDLITTQFDYSSTLIEYDSPYNTSLTTPKPPPPSHSSSSLISQSLNFNTKSKMLSPQAKMSITPTLKPNSEMSMRPTTPRSSRSELLSAGSATLMKVYNNDDLKYPFVVSASTATSNNQSTKGMSIISNHKNKLLDKLADFKAYSSLNHLNYLSNRVTRKNSRTMSSNNEDYLNNIIKDSNLSTNTVNDENNANNEHINNNINITSENGATTSSINDQLAERKSIKKPDYNVLVQKLREKSNLSAKSFVNISDNFTVNEVKTDDLIKNENPLSSSVPSTPQMSHHSFNLPFRHHHQHQLQNEMTTSNTNQPHRNSITSVNNMNDFSKNSNHPRSQSSRPNYGNQNHLRKRNSKDLNDMNYEFTENLIDRIRLKEFSTKSQINLNMLFKGFRNSISFKKDLPPPTLSTPNALKLKSLSLNDESDSEMEKKFYSSNEDSVYKKVVSVRPTSAVNIHRRNTNSALVNKNHFFRSEDSNLQVEAIGLTSKSDELNRSNSIKTYYVNAKTSDEFTKLNRREKTEMSITHRSVMHFLPSFNNKNSTSFKSNSNLPSQHQQNSTSAHYTNTITIPTQQPFIEARSSSLDKRASSAVTTIINNKTVDIENAQKSKNLNINKVEAKEEVLSPRFDKDLTLSKRIETAKQINSVATSINNTTNNYNNNNNNNSNNEKPNNTNLILNVGEDKNNKLSIKPEKIASVTTTTTTTTTAKCQQHLIRLSLINAHNNNINNNSKSNELLNNSPSSPIVRSPQSSASIVRVSKKRVSFHQQVVETDFDSGNSILKDIKINV